MIMFQVTFFFISLFIKLMATVTPPEIIIFNDTYISVNYQDSFEERFSNIVRIELSKQDGNILAEASIHNDDEREAYFHPGGILVQHLKEGQDLLAKINPCKPYDNMLFKIEKKGEESIIYGPIKFESIFKARINRWICYEDDLSVHLSLDSPENTNFRSCAYKIVLSRIVLSEGVNQDVKVPDSKIAKINIEDDSTF